MSFASDLASKDFNRKTLKALSTKGIKLVGCGLVPGADGTFANGERSYSVDDNGTGRVFTYLQVLGAAR